MRIPPLAHAATHAAGHAFGQPAPFELTIAPSPFVPAQAGTQV